MPCVLFIVFQGFGSVMNRISDGFDLAASKWKLKLSPLITARSVKTTLLIIFELDWSSMSRIFCIQTPFTFLGAVSSLMLDSSPAKIFKVDKGCFGLQRVIWLVWGNCWKTKVNSPLFPSSLLAGCFPGKKVLISGSVGFNSSSMLMTKFQEYISPQAECFARWLKAHWHLLQ